MGRRNLFLLPTTTKTFPTTGEKDSFAPYHCQNVDAPSLNTLKEVTTRKDNKNLNSATL